MSIEIQIEGCSLPVVQESGDTILRAALRAGVGFPYECSSGGCGSCKFDLVSGQVHVLWPEAPGLSERDRRKGRALACQCVAIEPVRINVRTDAEYVPRCPPKRQWARLVGTTDITHDLREFRFRGSRPAQFLPGQYASLAIEGIKTPRCYSMSNLANDEGEWHFQIRRVRKGEATQHLFEEMREGDIVEIDGPYGLAHLREENPRDIVCIAGGSGLAPMVSIARGAAAAGLLSNRRLHFIYGGRTPADLCGEQFLRELGNTGNSIAYHPVVSDEASAVDGSWVGNVGFAHDWIPRLLDKPLPTYEFYFAGPPPMTQAIQELLMVNSQVPFGQIHFDRFF